MSNPYLDAPLRARMYAKTWHKLVWVSAVVLSAGLLAPPLFFIAAKKRVVPMTVPALYAAATYGTAVLGDILGNGGNWVGGILALTLITAAVHAAILDTVWKTGR
ncbi:hypothetical protein [Streptomyces sp. NPDC088674]|uniref:hypothetical protein n=1 Tax=Streptomyces sp. NPDC088674 TaxID=3365869 RepID=UPI00380ACEE3